MNISGWRCEKIVQKVHRVSQKEIEQRLAELWEILVQGKSQFTRSQDVLSLTKSQSPLWVAHSLQPKRSLSC